MLNTLCTSLLSLAPLATLPLVRKSQNFSGRWARGWSSKTWKGKSGNLYQYGGSVLLQQQGQALSSQSQGKALHDGAGFSFGLLSSAGIGCVAFKGGGAFFYTKESRAKFGYLSLPHVYEKQSGCFRFDYSITGGLGIKNSELFGQLVNNFNFGLRTLWFKPKLQFKFLNINPVASFSLPIGSYFRVGVKLASFQPLPAFFFYWGVKGADEAFLEGLINLVEVCEKHKVKNNTSEPTELTLNQTCSDGSYVVPYHHYPYSPKVLFQSIHLSIPITQKTNLNLNSGSTDKKRVPQSQAQVYSTARANVSTCL